MPVNVSSAARNQHLDISYPVNIPCVNMLDNNNEMKHTKSTFCSNECINIMNLIILVLLLLVARIKDI